MAKDGRKNTDMPLSKQRNAREPKKGFWAYFFEPLPDDPDALDPFDELPETEPLSPDTLDELLSDGEKASPKYRLDSVVERITWEDGEPVVTDVPLLPETLSDEFAAPPAPVAPVAPILPPPVSATANGAAAGEEDDAAYALLRSSYVEGVAEAPAVQATVSAVDEPSAPTVLEPPVTAEPAVQAAIPAADEPTASVVPEPPVTVEPSAQATTAVDADAAPPISAPMTPYLPPEAAEPSAIADASMLKRPIPSFISGMPLTFDVGTAELPPDYVPLRSNLPQGDAFWTPPAPISLKMSDVPPQADMPSAPAVVDVPSAPAATDMPSIPAAVDIPLATVAPSEPYIPTVPTEPYIPAAPTEPYIPAAPSEPYVPAVPTEPYVPTAPTEPYIPAAPTEPYIPAVPTEPYVPAVPSEPYIPAPTEPSAGYVPLQSGIPDLPADGAVWTPPIEGTPAAPDALTATYTPREDAAVPPQNEWYGYVRSKETADEESGAAQEPIQLFDDDALTDTARRRGQTTRLFRTGTSATTRIHINETEEAVRREEAARRAQARAVKQKHDATVERRNKRKKRSTILRGLFANIAFVLFFIAAVIVALYYGFLLSAVVVMGNEESAYTDDMIIERSGLQMGRHLLLCDLDGAAEKIAEDPYLQVESVGYIFPNRIRIVVSIREAVARITGLDYSVTIDDQGYVLAMNADVQNEQLLQVSGVSITGFRLGQRLGEGNDFSTATLIELIDKLEQYELMDDTKSVDLTRPLAITMQMDNGLTVHVGQSTELDTKMQVLARLLPQFVSQDIGVGTLYLSAKGGAVYSPPSAAANAQPVTTNEPDYAGAVNPPDDTTFIDDDGDGLDDVTGLPQGAQTTPEPGATPSPSPAPTTYVPGGSADDFSG